MQVQTIQRRRSKPVILDSSGKPFRASATAEDVYNGFGGGDPYKGASHVRRASSQWNPGAGSADADTLGSINELRERSRDLARNVPVAGGALITLETNVVGAGLHCEPDLPNKTLGISEEQADDLEEQFKAEFALWGSSVECDVARKNTWEGVQQIAFRSWHESGDTCVLIPMFARPGSVYETKVQLVEADRVANPMNQPNTQTLVNGVEMDRLGAPVAYHILRRHPGDPYSLANFMATDRVEAFGKKSGRRNAWLLMDETRPGQTRGVPYLAIAMEQLKQIERYTDAELMAAVVGGSFTVFIKSEQSEDFMPIASMPFGTTSADAFSDNDYALDYGAIVPLRPGESIEQASPQRPNRVFGDFIRAIVEQIGAGIGIPFELLIKHFTASYSAARAALLEADKVFNKKRSRFAHGFCQPIYSAVIAEAILRGRLSAPGFFEDPVKRLAYLSCKWIGPSSSQLDPVNEAEAAEIRINAGMSTLASETPAIGGQDWREVHKQRVREKRVRLRDGLELAPAPPVAPAAPSANKKQTRGKRDGGNSRQR